MRRRIIDAIRRKSSQGDDLTLPVFSFDLIEGITYVTADRLHLIESMISHALILGIDTETQPSFYTSHSKEITRKVITTSIIQMAIRTQYCQEYVIVIDMLDIRNSYESLIQLNSILTPVLENEKVCFTSRL